MKLFYRLNHLSSITSFASIINIYREIILRCKFIVNTLPRTRVHEMAQCVKVLAAQTLKAKSIPCDVL